MAEIPIMYLRIPKKTPLDQITASFDTILFASTGPELNLFTVGDFVRLCYALALCLNIQISCFCMGNSVSHSNFTFHLLHSEEGPSPWFRLDLGDVFDVVSVTLTNVDNVNCGNCCK